jgi:YHS domain-containing protein
VHTTKAGGAKGICKVVKADPTNLVMKKLFVALFFATLVLPLAAQTKTLLNLDKTGLAIQGYDPVAFFNDAKPVKGKPEFPAQHNGALYYFASKEHRDVFKANPTNYEPAFGGYCAFGVSHNKLVEIEVDAFQIVDGRLLLQHSKGVRDDFNKDTKGNLSKADANWPVLVEKKGK